MAADGFDTGTELLLAERDGGVVVLRFNRPDRANALAPEVYAGFARVLPAIAADPTVVCVVLTGAGTIFCAGGDMKAAGERHADTGPPPTAEAEVERFQELHRTTVLALHRLPQITIAALPGAAAGAGFSFAMACDLRVASRRAKLVTAFVRMAAPGDFGATYFLTQLVGPSKAKELYVLSEPIGADEALALGLVNRVFDDDEFDAGWRGLAARVAAGPPIALRAIKENIERALVADVETCLDHEAIHTVASTATQDHREAVAAFLAKRPPAFVGR